MANVATSSAAPSSASPATSSAAPATRHSWVIDHSPFFYGWVILAAGSLGAVMMGPSQTFTVSLFIDNFVTDLGISRSTVSLIYGAATLGASLLLPMTGRLVDRYGTRRMMLAVTLAFVAALAAMSRVAGVAGLLLTLLAVRFLGFGSMQLVSNNVIAQWFVRRRGMVMGLASQSLAVSLFVFPALAEMLIRQFTWRGAWIGLSAIVLVIAAPAAWLLYRDRPELYGLQPDGNARGRYADGAGEEDWTLSEARRTSVFWVFTLAFLVMATVNAGLVFHQASLFVERGLSRSDAVIAYQAMALVSIIGNLGMGHLLDRVSARLLLVAQMGLLSTALLLLQVMDTMWMALIYATLLGLAMGGSRVMDSTVWAKYFGRRHLGSIRGATMVGSVGGTALGAYPLALSYDLAGSYSPALMALILLPIAISFSMIFVKRPQKRERREEDHAITVG